MNYSRKAPTWLVLTVFFVSLATVHGLHGFQGQGSKSSIAISIKMRRQWYPSIVLVACCVTAVSRQHSWKATVHTKSSSDQPTTAVRSVDSIRGFAVKVWKCSLCILLGDQ